MVRVREWHLWESRGESIIWGEEGLYEVKSRRGSYLTEAPLKPCVYQGTAAAFSRIFTPVFLFSQIFSGFLVVL
jgi:hypothetical protein